MENRGFKLLKKAFRLEYVDRTPWVPFVGVHGGKLIGVDAETYLKSAKHIVEGVSKAVEIYRADGIPVIFDLQVEAEILGCSLAWSKDNPPSVTGHPLANGTALDSLTIPNETDGRIPLVLDATRQLRKKHPDVALYGLITGPFTLAMHLRGTDLFMQIFEDPEYVNRLMQFCSKVASTYAEMLIDAGCDVIAVVDPMTSQIDPESFEAVVSPYMKSVFDVVRERGRYSSFFVCGHAQQNIEVMCNCRPDNISIDENIPLNFVKDIALKNDVSFGGNMKLTSVLLLGDEMDAKKDAISCMDLGGEKGFILAPGCDLAMDTPIENLQVVGDLVHDEYLQKVTREMEHTSSIEAADLTNHWQKQKIIVDVITLDSSSCAPCQYMVEAVKNAANGFGDKVIVNEFKIKDMEGIKMMKALGVQNVPTTCVNGKVEFISQIPPKSKIVEVISKALET